MKVFLNGVKSEIEDPKNRNKTRPNLPPDELKGLQDLIKLQKERTITIKPCDKGAGVIILDFDAYMNSCYEHLSQKQKQEDGNTKNYYEKVEETKLEEIKDDIKLLLEEGYENEYLTQSEYETMDPTSKGAARFYELFKVHKKHTAPETPPERPIISASGSVTENLGLFVEHYIKDLANKHPSYLQDTPDFLRMLEKRNEGPPLPPQSMLVTIDVSALYTNIPQEEGLQCVREALFSRSDPKVPTEFLVRLLEVVLKHNIFEFNSEFFIQLIGTAMGCGPAPSYANIFMANKIDPAILRLARESESGEDPIDLFKRFLDDIFLVYTGSIQSLHLFLSELNNLHPTIKFTMSHTTPSHIENPACECTPEESLPFLDTSCKILDGKIVTDLFRKETDRNQYLLPNSCHPAHVTQNIPYSLALRIVRICTFSSDREKRFSELRELLLSRDYRPGIINSAIEKARNVPRSEALKRVSKQKSSRRPIFVMNFDPRLPSIPDIVKKHWRSMT